jgi:zinc/manganese transport system substrate-binding protein
VKYLYFLLLLCFGMMAQIPASLAQKPTAPIYIIAAENFYGDIAKALGGDHVEVSSILKNPAQDPHAFSTSPSIAKAVLGADIVIYNGAHYDDWMARLLSASSQQAHAQTVMVVADLVGVKSGDNPHIWYIPSTMSHYAEALSQHLIALDPSHTEDYKKRLTQFQLAQTALQNTVAALRKKTEGAAVTATEPVFNYMAEALGLKMQHMDFQWSIENESAPSPAAVQRMQDDLKNHRVRILFYNTQVTSPLVDQLKSVAEKSHVPIVGVTETQPLGVTYHQWMQQQLEAVKEAFP